MKKVTALLIFLLILGIPIFLKISNPSLHSSPSRLSLSAEPKHTANAAVSEAALSSKRSSNSPFKRSSTSAKSKTPEGERNERQTPARLPSFQSLTPQSPFYYVHSEAIVPPSDRDELFLERLQQLIEVLLQKLNPAAIVFDVDGDSTNQVPVVTPANKALDLTPFLKELFEENQKALRQQGPPGLNPG